MDTVKKLTVEEIQGYIVNGVTPLPIVYDQFLDQLHTLQKQRKICMLPMATFDLYHSRLRRKLIERIVLCKRRKQEREAKTKAA